MSTPAERSRVERLAADLEACEGLEPEGRIELAQALLSGEVSVEFAEDILVHAGREWDEESQSYIIDDEDPLFDGLDEIERMPVADPDRFGHLAEQLGYVVVELNPTDAAVFLSAHPVPELPEGTERLETGAILDRVDQETFDALEAVWRGPTSTDSSPPASS